MKLFKRFHGEYILVALAVAFVAFHVLQFGATISSFAEAYYFQPKAQQAVMTSIDSPLDSRQYAGSVTYAGGIELGMNVDHGKWPVKVSMPSVAVQLPLTGSMEKAGTWDISLTGANFATNTAIPNGVTGNTVLFGHDRPGLFKAIHNLKTGDQIYVSTPSTLYVYKVNGYKVVTPKDISVMDQTDGSTLTLITCDGADSSYRFVITAAFDYLAPISQTK